MGGSGERSNKNELCVSVRMLSLQAWKIQYKHLFISQDKLPKGRQAVQSSSDNSPMPPKCWAFSSSLTLTPHRASVVQQCPIHSVLGWVVGTGAGESRTVTSCGAGWGAPFQEGRAFSEPQQTSVSDSLTHWTEPFLLTILPAAKEKSH